MQEELDSMDAEQLRQARELLDKTQTQLALEVGVKPGKHMDRTVRRWERGELNHLGFIFFPFLSF